MNIYDEIPKETLDQFREYHMANRWIYREFRKKALELLATGRKRYGAKAIMEAVRFDYDMDHPDDEFKISNSYTAYYARLLAHKDPRFRNFFRFKPITGLKQDGRKRCSLARDEPFST